MPLPSKFRKRFSRALKARRRRAQIAGPNPLRRYGHTKREEVKYKEQTIQLHTSIAHATQTIANSAFSDAWAAGDTGVIAPAMYQNGIYYLSNPVQGAGATERVASQWYLRKLFLHGCWYPGAAQVAPRRVGVYVVLDRAPGPPGGVVAPTIAEIFETTPRMPVTGVGLAQTEIMADSHIRMTMTPRFTILWSHITTVNAYGASGTAYPWQCLIRPNLKVVHQPAAPGTTESYTGVRQNQIYICFLMDEPGGAPASLANHQLWPKLRIFCRYRFTDL